MTRIAVLGANGQVGAELCLLLAQQEGVEVIPVCRSRFGSAYLRYRGIACRHGQLTDPIKIRELVGDCDVVANLVLVGTLTNPRAARITNRVILKNVIAQAAPHAKHIYFSTMSVYGDARQGQRIVIRNSYAQDKWRCEKTVRALASRAARELFVFRLGHVCGELQGITYQIRQRLRSGTIQVADPERLSNTVQVATIADAVLKVANGTIAPATYDLMNVPQWTWRQVCEHEAHALGVVHRLDVIGDPQRASLSKQFNRIVSKAIVACAEIGVLRRAASRFVPILPMNWYHSVKALYAVRSAGADINRLALSAEPMEAVFRVPVGNRFASGLTETASLLAQRDFQFLPDPPIEPVRTDTLPRAVAAN